MYKKSTAIRCRHLPCVPLKLFLIMKLSLFLCLVCIMQVAAAPSFGQKISLDKNNASLIETLKDIRQQSGFSLFYNAKMLRKAVPVNVHLENTDLSEVLKECFKDQPFGYVINNNTIVVIPKVIVAAPVPDIVITGQVRDEKGAPLPGVTVKIKGTNTGAQTGVDGTYKVSVPGNNAVLVFSFIGFVTREIPVGNQTQND